MKPFILTILFLASTLTVLAQSHDRKNCRLNPKMANNRKDGESNWSCPACVNEFKAREAAKKKAADERNRQHNEASNRKAAEGKAEAEKRMKPVNEALDKQKKMGTVTISNPNNKQSSKPNSNSEPVGFIAPDIEIVQAVFKKGVKLTAQATGDTTWHGSLYKLEEKYAIKTNESVIVANVKGYQCYDVKGGSSRVIVQRYVKERRRYERNLLNPYGRLDFNGDSINCIVSIEKDFFILGINSDQAYSTFQSTALKIYDAGQAKMVDIIPSSHPLRKNDVFIDRIGPVRRVDAPYYWPASVLNTAAGNFDRWPGAVEKLQQVYREKPFAYILGVVIHHWSRYDSRLVFYVVDDKLAVRQVEGLNFSETAR